MNGVDGTKVKKNIRKCVNPDVGTPRREEFPKQFEKLCGVRARDKDCEDRIFEKSQVPQ